MSYSYDSKENITSKTVNGTAINFTTKNGVIQSQTDGTDTMYLQHDNLDNPDIL